MRNKKSQEEISVEWYVDGSPCFKIFSTDEEAIKFAEKELGFKTEWIISSYRLIDANYVNYN